MPAQDGCHQPESGGTKCPICGYQAPVDNFANPQSFPLKGGTQPESFIVLVRGCQMPELAKLIWKRFAACAQGMLEGVPDARTPTALSRSSNPKGYHLPESYFSMPLTCWVIFGTGGWEGRRIRPPSTGSILASG